LFVREINRGLALPAKAFHQDPVNFADNADTTEARKGAADRIHGRDVVLKLPRRRFPEHG